MSENNAENLRSPLVRGEGFGDGLSDGLGDGLMETHVLPNVTLAMLSPDYWVSDARCTKDESANRPVFQQHIREHATSMTTLVDVWQSLGQASEGNGTETAISPASDIEYRLGVRAQVPPVPPLPNGDEVLYNADGQPFTDGFWDALKAKIENAHPVDEATGLTRADSFIPVQPGFSVTRANVRRFPLAKPGFRLATDREFDRFQDTALHTFEPVLIALQTVDKRWYYVISETYDGWVSADDIARATTAEFVKWSAITKHSEGPGFLVPLASNVYTQVAPYDEAVSGKRLEFGAYLPLCEDQHGMGNQSIAGNFSIYLPVRNSDGWLEVKQALVPRLASFSVGFRAYTRRAVVESAFALLGERYGWGDRCGNHDCSSLIMDSYRTLGIQLPRDAHHQEEALPNLLPIPKEASFAERTELLKSLSPGDPLYMPGHTMMYLGYRAGHHYVIHDFAGYSEPDGESLRSVPVNEVMVSTLDIQLTSGKTYLEALTSAASLFAD
ncbi:SH3 domain-containing protein [Alicyclobacillus curvatus]|nr:SH3 domain-containing protein [Alicyclobacillus curvatus]